MPQPTVSDRGNKLMYAAPSPPSQRAIPALQKAPVRTQPQQTGSQTSSRHNSPAPEVDSRPKRTGFWNRGKDETPSPPAELPQGKRQRQQ